MNSQQAHTAVVTSALIVGGVYAYRKLVEPVSEPAGAHNSTVETLIGAGEVPANVAQFAVAYSFAFVSLAILAEISPDLGGGLAAIVAVGELLVNGGAVFADVNRQVAATTSGKPAETKNAAAVTPAGVNTTATATVGAANVHLTGTGQLH